MDEPASALDPVSTSKIEDLIFQLKSQYTIVIVTHNMQQAARVAEKTGFFLNGRMVEFDSTHKIFTNPSDKRTGGLHHGAGLDDTHTFSTKPGRSEGKEEIYLVMAGLAEQAIQRAIEAYRGSRSFHHRPGQPQPEIAINRMERDIETRPRSTCSPCRSSPWPSICASLLSVIKINADLVRVGDAAKSISDPRSVLWIAWPPSSIPACRHSLREWLQLRCRHGAQKPAGSHH